MLYFLTMSLVPWLQISHLYPVELEPAAIKERNMVVHQVVHGMYVCEFTAFSHQLEQKFVSRTHKKSYNLHKIYLQNEIVALTPEGTALVHQTPRDDHQCLRNIWRCQKAYTPEHIRAMTSCELMRIYLLGR